MTRTRVAVAAAVATISVLLAGCGSRLPARDFQAQPAAPGAAGSGNSNTASDVGVTADSITVGMIDTVNSLLGSETLSGPMYGAQAFFRALNDHGGVNGRTVQVASCDDEGAGYLNQACARKLVDDRKVFAFAGNSVYQYDGAAYVSSKGVPDVGGQPIGNAYDQYPHLYSIYGSSAPRNGTLGWNGTLYATTETYRYFRQRLGAHTAAVVSYNQADSSRYAQTIAAGLRAEGYTVVPEQVDLALPNFNAAVVDMKSRGVDIVFDSIDTTGNAALCSAMDGAGLHVQAKVTNVQNWNAQTAGQFKASPACRNTIQATGSSRNYEDTGNAEVARFRDAMARYFPNRADKMSQWELEGWASAQWLTDAIASCGARVTRSCVEDFVNRPQGYDAHGLLIPATFTAATQAQAAAGGRACLNVVRWQDSAQAGHGGWVDQVPDMDTNCFDVPAVAYRP